MLSVHINIRYCLTEDNKRNVSAALTIIPSELANYFNLSHFLNYPLIEIPQSFHDNRGTILNLADGVIGDIAIITSVKDSVRANHIHKEDWHLCYLVSGEMRYFWKDELESKETSSTKVQVGEMIYTPPNTPHRIEFSEDSIFLSIARLSRLSELYELDTSRFQQNLKD